MARWSVTMTALSNFRWPASLAALALTAAAAPVPATSIPATCPADGKWDKNADFGWTCRFRDENRALIAAGTRPNVVFMGDSISEGWKNTDPAYFGNGRVDRGISGQTTPQMVLRFDQDVIALHPAIVHILAGANDIAGNTGPMTLEQTEANIRRMAESARAHGIRVVIGSGLPARAFPWRPELRPAAKIAQLNQWLRDYARQRGFVYADYYSAMADPDGGMHAGLSVDGVHPDAAGYAVMDPIADAALAATVPAGARQQLDANFIADRVLVDAPLANGQSIRFWSDTGGGTTILYDRRVKKFALETQPVSGKMTDDMPPNARQLAHPLALAPSAFPAPPNPIMVMPDQLAPMGMPADSDGNIGQNWFAGHIWTWDYPHGTLTIEKPGWQPAPAAHVVRVTFREATRTMPALHFPRLTVVIAGEPTSVLLDTGATTILTPEAQALIGGPRLRATSMIVASRIAAWRKAHPDWRVIEHGQSGTGSTMIEVPDVKVAGFEVGPIWFTSRPDSNFHEMMSGGMDAQVEGAIGGNAFHSLRMTVDYLHGRAAFTRG
jgi:lysophospholipase L1-like esterase